MERQVVMRVLRILGRLLMRAAIIFLLGMTGMWFVLSFAWSREEMSILEQVVGVVYLAVVVPAFFLWSSERTGNTESSGEVAMLQHTGQEAEQRMVETGTIEQ